MIMVEYIYSCEPPVRVGRVEEWGKVDETIASNCFIFMYLVEGGREGGRAAHSSLTTSLPKDGGDSYLMSS